MINSISLISQPLIGHRRVHQGQVVARDEVLERPLKRQECRPVLRSVAPAFAHNLRANVNC